MSTPDERQQLALSQGTSALAALRTIGVEAELVGSVVWGQFHGSSDVDFLVIDDGGVSDGVIYEAIASRLDFEFDLIFLSRLRPTSRDLILKQRAENSGLRAMRSGNRAAIELSAMRERLGSTDESARAAVKNLTAGSESAKAAWLHDGLLVGGTQLAEAWSCSLQTLEQARNRGELFCLQFQGRPWYPSVMTSVSSADVGQVSTVLQRLDAVSQFIFWIQRHGSLGGFTTAEAIAAGKLGIVVRLAHAFAEQ